MIGFPVRVVWSRHKGYNGIEGIIVSESRNMILISLKDSSLRKIPKKSVALELSIPDYGAVRIDGEELVGRPEDRIKKKRRKTGRL